MTLPEGFDLMATVNRVFVPEHHYGPRNRTQQLFQKGNDLFSCDGGAIALQEQPDPALVGTDAHSPD